MPSLDKRMDKLVVPGLVRSRKVYVLKKLGDDWKFATLDLVKRQLAETDELANATQFGSRLQARQETLNSDRGEINGFVAAEWDYIQIELVPEQPKIEVIEGLMIEDPVTAIQRVCDLHMMYCNRVSNWVRRATNVIQDYTHPRVCITVRPQMKWAGLYSPVDHTCHYVLPLAMLNLGRAPGKPADYEETIAHEVVHAYQHHFVGQRIGGGGHGGDFYAMMRHAALYPTETHTHAPLPGEFQKCIKLFHKLQRPMEKLAEDGMLASLPCTFVTQSIKRAGVA